MCQVCFETVVVYFKTTSNTCIMPDLLIFLFSTYCSVHLLCVQIVSHGKKKHCNYVKVKVGVLRPVQQPGSYWDRSSELPLVGLEPTEVTAYD